jgi:hypothetical protein
MILPFAPNQDHLVVTCIFAETAMLCDYLHADLGKIAPGLWTRQDGEWRLDDCYVGEPQPGARHRKTLLAFSPEPEKYTFLVANTVDGWNSLAYRLGKAIGIDALILGFSSDEIAYPARYFTLLHAGSQERHVGVRFEDRWLFYERGKPLPQEETGAYTKRLIRDRLTNLQLVEIAASKGIEAFRKNGQLSGTGAKFFQKSDSPERMLRPIEVTIFHKKSQATEPSEGDTLGLP